VFQIKQNEVLGKTQIQYKWQVASGVLRHKQISDLNPRQQLSDESCAQSKPDPSQIQENENQVKYEIPLILR
jgi:hypothetical protein